MNRNTMGLVLAGLVTGAAVAMLAVREPLTSNDSRQESVVTGKAIVGGPFALKGADGRTVTDKDFLGRYMLVFFGFTNCPDICPSGLQVMSAALDKLGAKADAVTPVFITLDAERDTPEKLAQYAKSFHPRLVALTGTPAELAAVAKAYRVYSQKVANEADPANYTIDHSSIFYLMGKDGTLLQPIPYTTNVDELTAALDNALS